MYKRGRALYSMKTIFCNKCGERKEERVTCVEHDVYMCQAFSLRRKLLLGEKKPDV